MNFQVKSGIPALSNLCLVFTYLHIADAVKWVQYILVQRLIDTINDTVYECSLRAVVSSNSQAGGYVLCCSYMRLVGGGIRVPLY